MARTTNEHISNAFMALGFHAGPFREDEHCTTRIAAKQATRFDTGVYGGRQSHYRVYVEDVRQGKGQSVEIHEATSLRVTVFIDRTRDYHRVAENVAPCDVKKTIARLYEALD